MQTGIFGELSRGRGKEDPAMGTDLSGECIRSGGAGQWII